MLHYTCSITKYRKDELCISIRTNSERYRYYNGLAIGEPDKPNLLPVNKRYKGFQELLIKYQIALRSGWLPKRLEKSAKPVHQQLQASVLLKVFEDKRRENLSFHFYKDFKSYINRMIPLVDDVVTEEVFQKMVDTHPHWSNTSFNNYVRYASIIEKGLQRYGYQGSWSKKVKRRRQEETLHKKIDNLQEQLSLIKEFNTHLHLCALLTYGCLLRPHREVRELTWGDFKDEHSIISLAGSRNKSKRNRIIPVPEYVRVHLTGGERTHNIFSGTAEPFNHYYFSLLWQRFKRKHPEVVQQGQTLYSYRHMGAIAVYEKSKNIKVLQTVMGHSDMTVSLTYLRGLEVVQLDQNDMPKLQGEIVV